ncbi:MBL fold metallo-hydrolase [Tahibacter caeni]|uniref:MBL fold metallo-hydrolase n=1 Tax=Tahibacter caeni TaxID=1453545 RepID=UPI00214912C6|nr:MBL fold metallo-hydrolase [Tahibacter caeni]
MNERSETPRRSAAATARRRATRTAAAKKTTARKSAAGGTFATKAAARKAAAKTAADGRTATKNAVAKKAVAKKAAKKTAAKKAATTRRGAARKAASRRGSAAPVFIRHYCQGIGDCHLLRFDKDDGSPWHLLIDCGLHSSVPNAGETMDAIVADIATVTQRIDVLVITHEHWDHVSGFSTAAEHFAGIEVGEVWMAWTENPRDKQAREFDEFKGKALAALQRASLRLDGLRSLDDNMSGVRDGLQALLGFQFGAKGEKVRAARDAGAALNTEGIRYLEPSSAPLQPEGLGNLRIYVLGPPRDTNFFSIRERASEMYMAAAAAASLERTLGPDDICAVDTLAPFDPNLGLALDDAIGSGEAADGDEAALRRLVRDLYAAEGSAAATDQRWRRIDGDWLGASADLAMQLDDRTNNSSLVLAFEFADSGRVLLFAADAQIGNWLSWQDLKWDVDGAAVTGPELLSRVVYYKVGHHGSQNATAKSKGLQLMNDPDLAAFVPTNEVDAKRVKWGEMPFHGILADLERRADGRVIRADDAWLRSGTVDARFRKANGALQRVAPGGDGLWVDVEVR